MKVIRRSPDKYWIFVGDRAFVLKVRREVALIPRWRVVSALTFSAFGSGLALAGGAAVPGIVLGLVALFLTWGASR